MPNDNPIPASSVGAPHIRDRVFIVAHAQEPRERRLSVRRGRPRSQAGNADGRGQDVPDAVSDALRIQPESVFWRSGAPISGHAGGWSAQCRLGIAAHELPGGLDCGGWECGVPRVMTGQTDRVARLRGLGNAVVPAVAEHIGRLIMGAAVTDGG